MLTIRRFCSIHHFRDIEYIKHFLKHLQSFILEDKNIYLTQPTLSELSISNVAIPQSCYPRFIEQEISSRLSLVCGGWKAVKYSTTYIDPSQAVVNVSPLGILGFALSHLGYIKDTTLTVNPLGIAETIR